MRSMNAEDSVMDIRKLWSKAIRSLEGLQMLMNPLDSINKENQTSQLHPLGPDQARSARLMTLLAELYLRQTDARATFDPSPLDHLLIHTRLH